MKNLLLLTGLLIVATFSFSFTNRKPTTALSKSLIFPVGSKKSNVGSFWGDVRDGGRRSHEGIDIFARKGTPVVAICDGVIVSRGNTRLGGKILWLQSGKYGWNVYYAHLDEQLVREGQRVKKGQVLGTVGNTGNARTTPAHLHFGIYTNRGAVNPYPYVKHSPKISAKLPKAAPKKSTAKKKTTAVKKTAVTSRSRKKPVASKPKTRTSTAAKKKIRK